jgi:hypothetical protein
MRRVAASCNVPMTVEKKCAQTINKNMVKWFDGDKDKRRSEENADFYRSNAP